MEAFGRLRYFLGRPGRKKRILWWAGFIPFLIGIILLGAIGYNLLQLNFEAKSPGPQPALGELKLPTGTMEAKFIFENAGPDIVVGDTNEAIILIEIDRSSGQIVTAGNYTVEIFADGAYYGPSVSDINQFGFMQLNRDAQSGMWIDNIWVNYHVAGDRPLYLKVQDLDTGKNYTQPFISSVSVQSSTFRNQNDLVSLNFVVTEILLFIAAIEMSISYLTFIAPLRKRKSRSEEPLIRSKKHFRP